MQQYESYKSLYKAAKIPIFVHSKLSIEILKMLLL